MSLESLNRILHRGLPYSTLERVMNRILLDNANVRPLILLAFQTRDIAGGKGERRLGLDMFKFLMSHSSTRDIMNDVLYRIPEHGSWKDLVQLYNETSNDLILDIIERQFLQDERAMALGEPASLLAKWLPREGKTGVFAFVSRLVSGTMFVNTRMKLYRKRVSALNRYINTVEVKMCGNQWHTIVPKEVPDRAMKKYIKAFLNEPVVESNKLRCPESSSRMLCRKNFHRHFLMTEN